MKRPILVSIVLALAAGQALAQTIGPVTDLGPPAPTAPVAPAPAPLPAQPSAVGTPAVAAPVAPPSAQAGAPVITIDPRGFTGGTGAGMFSGLGTVIVDPLAGGASAQPVLPQTSAGADAALRASTPTSLDPAPTGDAYPFCRNPNDQRCRARSGTRVAQ